MSRIEDPEVASHPAVPVKQAAPAPAMWRGRNLPWWVNALLGAFIIIVGIFFFFNPARGMTGSWQWVFLVGYFVIGGLYVGKAYRQYTSRGNP